MQCPNDHTDLVIADRQGVEIDYCPKCRGVWLDRGELDKLIERATQYSIPAQRQPYADEAQRSASHDDRPRPTRHHDDDDDDNYRSHGDSHGHKKPHKKESFLGELFDF